MQLVIVDVRVCKLLLGLCARHNPCFMKVDGAMHVVGSGVQGLHTL